MNLCVIIDSLTYSTSNSVPSVNNVHTAVNVKNVRSVSLVNNVYSVRSVSLVNNIQNVSFVNINSIKHVQMFLVRHSLI